MEILIKFSKIPKRILSFLVSFRQLEREIRMFIHLFICERPSQIIHYSKAGK